MNIYHHIPTSLVGGFKSSEKYESQLGLFIIPNIWTNMFQTTNQIIYQHHHFAAISTVYRSQIALVINL